VAARSCSVARLGLPRSSSTSTARSLPMISSRVCRLASHLQRPFPLILGPDYRIASRPI